MKDLFLSHTWRPDEEGRKTHERVQRLAGVLRCNGWTVWIDADDLLYGNVDVAMARGIDNSKVVLVCITREYINKVNYGLDQLDHRDNCAKEWCYAMTRKKIMLPVILEASMLNTTNWPPGVVPLHLGNCLYVDASGDNWSDVAKSLTTMLVALGVRPVGRRIRRPHRLPPLPPAPGGCTHSERSETPDASGCWKFTRTKMFR